MKTSFVAIALSAFFLAWSAGARAQSISFDDAMAACRTTVSEDANGTVNQTLVDDCMKNYGFAPSSETASGGGGERAALSAAQNLCASSGGPGSAEFEACMTARGFPRPDDGGRTIGGMPLGQAVASSATAASFSRSAR